MKNTNNEMELFQEKTIEQYVAFDYSKLDSKIALELQQKAKKARMIINPSCTLLCISPYKINNDNF